MTKRAVFGISRIVGGLLGVYGLLLAGHDLQAASLWGQMVWDQDTWAEECPNSDGDSITDCEDNCLVVSNPTQLDTDNDNIGNLCDCDFNQDNFCGGPDFTRFISGFNGAPGPAAP